MPAKSQAQQQAAGIALKARRGEISQDELRGASKQMSSMSVDELEKFAGTKRAGLPEKKGESLEQIGQRILGRLLVDSEEMDNSAEEHQEVSLARNVLDGVHRLQSSLPDPSPEQQRALTMIRAAAHSLVRIHGSSL